MIYLDYAANCPTNKEVLAVFNEITTKYYANPNSIHKFGLEANSIISESTIQIANLLSVAPNEIIYTSGATESNNLAIKGIVSKYKHGKILTTSLEHSSVVGVLNEYKNNYDIEIIPLGEDGRINLNELNKMLTSNTILVTINYVDSELGIVQDVNAIAKLIKEKSQAVFHLDATGAIGKIGIDFSHIDLITLAPHKFYGLSGIGILIKKSKIVLIPQIVGGHSTTIYRSGTPNTALIASSAKAIEIALTSLDNNYKYVSELNKYLKEELCSNKNIVINNTRYSLPYYLNISFNNVDSQHLQKYLSTNEVYVSTGSACKSGNIATNVMSVTQNIKLAKTSIRISLSPLTTKQELEKFVQIINKYSNEKSINIERIKI